MSWAGAGQKGRGECTSCGIICKLWHKYYDWIVYKTAKCIAYSYLSLLNWNVVDYAANKILRKPTSNGWELRCVHVLKISCRYFWNWAAAAADGGDGGGVATVLAVLEIGFSQANKTSDVPVAGAKNVFITFRARVFCATRKILEATTTTTRGAGAEEEEQE